EAGGEAPPVAVAGTVKLPVWLLAVREGAATVPLLSVVTVIAPAKVPLGPDAGAEKVTVTPATGLPALSLTCARSKEENCCNTVADCGVPPMAMMLAAAPAVIWNVLLSAGVSWPAVSPRRLAPPSGKWRSVD